MGAATQARFRLVLGMALLAALALGIADALDELSPRARLRSGTIPSHGELSRTSARLAETTEDQPPLEWFNPLSVDPPRNDDLLVGPRSRAPDGLLSATTTLFKEGLPDPRSGEYRVIEVSVGSCWTGGGGVVSTHGWVLPDRSRQRRAVCWNGMIYPVRSVGAPASVQADVAALVRADEQFRLSREKENGAGSFTRYHPAWPEKDSVSHDQLLPIKACLLLRLGEDQLAEQVWSAWTGGKPSETGDTYLMLATDWTWALFDRAVCAHMRGDDRVALAVARALANVQPRIEAEAARRGSERPFNFRNRTQPLPYLGFLEPLPALLADQERRARQPDRARQRQAELQKASAKPRRIALLIEELEEVAARQMGQPGGVSLAADAVVWALIQQGEDAIEPLLKCLEDDTRLTRSVHFHRDFFSDRSLIGTHEAAYVALSGILQSSFFRATATGDDLTAHGPEGRKRVADQIRDHCRQFRGVALEERWYRTLADGSAGAERWQEAAAGLVQPTTESTTPSSMFGGGWRVVSDHEPDERPRMCGEPLRGKKTPSVGDLMRKRLRSLVFNYEAGVKDDLLLQTNAMARHNELVSLTRFAHTLADWDGPAALPDLQWFSAVLLKAMTTEQAAWSAGQLVTIYQRRLRLRDAKALQEYAFWLATVREMGNSSEVSPVFEPVAAYPDDPAIVRAMERLFDDPLSSWVPAVNGKDGYAPNYLVQTRVLAFACVRRRVLEALADTRPTGTAQMREEGDGMLMNLDHGPGGSFSYDPRPDPLAPAAGTKVSFRVCDHFAWVLGRVGGAPRCELYWPENKRDEAVAACAAFFRQYGERLKPEADLPRLSVWYFNPAYLVFAPLERPATAEDVAGGRAIFTLGTKEPVRVWKMPARVLEARWTTLKDYPRQSTALHLDTGKPNRVTTYDQNGAVWQAEEVFHEGRWQRSYGFVAAHRLARVPAEEIEFPEPGWNELSRGLDCRLCFGHHDLEDGVQIREGLAVGRPLPITAALRNRRGVAQEVPATLYRKDRGGPALAPGVQVRLWFAPLKVSRLGEIEAPSWYDEDAWQELPGRNPAALSPDSRTRTIEPTQFLRALQFDPHDHFDLTRPGAYRLRLDFRAEKGGFAEGESSEVWFTLVPSGAKKP